jgi:hypothetical protein
VARLDDPEPADRARVKQRLTLLLGASAFGGAAAGGQLASSSGASWFGGAKGGLFGTTGKLALCASVLGGALFIAWPSAQPAPKPVEARGSAREQNLAHRPSPAPLVLPASPPSPSLEEQPAPAASPGAQPPRAPVPQPARARSRAHPASAQAVNGAPSSLTQELALLAQAQAALRAGAPAQALALAQQHQQRFPEGALREERLGVEALAECDLGRKDARHATAFLRAAPNSPLAARVRKACGLE